MDTEFYRHVFSWPTQDIFEPGSEDSLNDLQIDLVDDSIEDVFMEMIKKAKNEDRDESFAMFDMGSVVERYQLWQEMFPTIRPYYAMKAYDDPAVVKLLSLLGAGFDCASKNEIKLAMKVGVKPENIIFANTVKIPSHICYAAKSGVQLMTFDNREELIKIKKCSPNARLLLRICPIINHPALVENSFSCVFGCTLDAVPDIFQTAKELDLSIVGVAFHTGSGTRGPEVYVDQIKLARKVFDIAEDHDIHMEILDIGGGFLGRKGSEDLLLQISNGINSCLMETFPDGSGVTVLAEPGRYFIDAGLTLAASVIGKKHKLNNYEMEMEYYLSESVFGLTCRNFLPDVQSWCHYSPSVVRRDSQEKSCPSDTEQETIIIRGPSVHPQDFNPYDGLPELEVGDWLVFEDMGSYTITRCCGFNGLPIAPIRRVMKRNIWKSLKNIE